MTASEERPESIEPTERPAFTSHVPDKPKKRTARSRGPIRAFFRELAIITVVALALSTTIKTFFVQSFYIPSSSMENTLQVGDRIIVNKLADSADELHRGDIVVFVDPGGWLPEPQEPSTTLGTVITDVLTFVGIIPQHAGHHLIKRVIGLPGDHVQCCTADGLITVNGVPITEPYLRPGSLPSEVPFDVVVPEDSLWVMGDNRQGSSDSRAHQDTATGGFVPISFVEGRAAYIIYPFSRFSWLGGADASFTGVP